MNPVSRDASWDGAWEPEAGPNAGVGRAEGDVLIYLAGFPARPPTRGYVLAVGPQLPAGGTRRVAGRVNEGASEWVAAA